MEKMKIKKIIIYFFVTVILLLASYFYSITDVKTKIYNQDIDNSEWSITSNMLEGDIIYQPFLSKETKINSIEVSPVLVTVKEDSNIKLVYSILDDKKQTLSSNEIRGSELKDSRINKLNFDNPINTEIDKKYYVSFSLKDYKENENIFLNSIDNDENSNYLSYESDNKIANSTLVMRIINHRFSLETFVVCLFFVVFIAGFLKYLFYLFKK